MPHGRRGRAAQPCRATVQRPPAPPAAGPEAGAGGPLGPGQGSLSPAPSPSPAGSPRSGAAAGRRGGVGQPAPRPRGRQCPASRPRRGKPCAPARGCPRPAASPRSPAPASRSRCDGSSWLRRAAAVSCSARPGLLPRSLRREAGPAAASRRPGGRRGRGLPELGLRRCAAASGLVRPYPRSGTRTEGASTAELPSQSRPGPRRPGRRASRMRDVCHTTDTCPGLCTSA